MNKVLNINLNGLVFSIDETAYEQLKKYLDKLKKHFEGTEGAAEIIADIEARIAELLHTKISDKYAVIQLVDVNEVIGMMGDPLEIDGEEEPQPKPQKRYSQVKTTQLRRDPHHKTLGGVCAGLANYFGIDIMIPRILFLIAFFTFGSGLLVYLIMWMVIPEANGAELTEDRGNTKRLFRNPDDKKVGGVCSGIAEYLSVDAVWLRLAFLIALFVFGTGFIAYLILWIAIPLAKTSADKLLMKGESIDVSNIEKVVRNTIVKTGDQVKNNVNNATKNINQAAGSLSELVRILLKVVGKILGASLLILSIIVIGVIVFLWNYSFSDILQKLDVTAFYFYFQYGFGLFTFSIAALIMLIGIKLMFHTRIKIKLITVLLITATIVGLGLMLNFGLQYKKSVSIKEVVKEKTISAICPDTLYIKTIDFIDEETSFADQNELDLKYQNYKINELRQWVKLFHRTKLTVNPSKTDSLYLGVVKSARGSSELLAKQTASDIEFNHTITGNTLRFDQGVSLPKSTPFKFQQIFAKLKIPVGTILVVDRPIMKMINSAYEEDFDLGETLKMTNKGLKCLDCFDTQNKDEETNIEFDVTDDDGEVNIRIQNKNDDSNKPQSQTTNEEVKIIKR